VSAGFGTQDAHLFLTRWPGALNGVGFDVLFHGGERHRTEEKVIGVAQSVFIADELLKHPNYKRVTLLHFALAAGTTSGDRFPF
jgi:hypothetical protein